MDTANQALSVYRKAEARWIAHKETKADEVLLALWDINKEQAKTIREMAQIVSAATEKCAELARGSNIKT